jgi:hypothetical protein
VIGLRVGVGEGDGIGVGLGFGISIGVGLTCDGGVPLQKRLLRSY